MALIERDPFAYQSVEIRGIDMGETERGDRVVPLLVGDDENDVRALIQDATGYADPKTIANGDDQVKLFFLAGEDRVACVYEGSRL